LNYLLTRQGLCFALLIPVIIYGFEGRQKTILALGICIVSLLVFDLGSLRLGISSPPDVTGLSHGLFSVLSLIQFTGLSAVVIYVQNYMLKHVQHTVQASDKLKRMAIRDGLTGLFNHSFTQQLIGDAINRARRSKNPLALLMIDVDSFKQINDTYGHNAGDEMLASLTRLLQSNKRSTDYLGRWGGDELVLLLTETDLSGAANLAEKLRRLVESQVFPHGRKLTLSIGASQYREGDYPNRFIARADAAMYRAKRGGRNKVEVQG
jgi:diguanylate cyclase (GGDEF)-like protein